MSFIFSLSFWKTARSCLWKTTNHSTSKLYSLSLNIDAPLWDMESRRGHTHCCFLVLCPLCNPPFALLNYWPALYGDRITLHKQSSEQMNYIVHFVCISTHCNCFETNSFYWDYKDFIHLWLLIHWLIAISAVGFILTWNKKSHSKHPCGGSLCQDTFILR